MSQSEEQIEVNCSEGCGETNLTTLMKWDDVECHWTWICDKCCLKLPDPNDEKANDD